MKRRTDTTELIDLFPFLSVMLCVVGVLAFLQILMSSGIGQGKRLPGQVHAGSRVGYQVLCKPEGIVLLPPATDEGIQGLRVIGRTEKKAVFLNLRQQRCQELADVRRKNQAPSVVGEPKLLTTLEEIQLVNRAAQRHGLQYEEFLLFVIYPGGGAQYHSIRSLLDRPEFRNIPFGLLSVGPDAQIDLATCPEETP